MTVENPMNRTYSETALSEISTSLHSMSGPLAALEASAPDAIQVSKGHVKGIEARRFRLIFGTSFADVWMTKSTFANPWGFSFWNPMVPQTPQLNVQSNQAEVIAAQQDAITRSVRKRNEVWRQLVDKSAALKKFLSIKYGLPF